MTRFSSHCSSDNELLACQVSDGHGMHAPRKPSQQRRLRTWFLSALPWSLLLLGSVFGVLLVSQDQASASSAQALAASRQQRMAAPEARQGGYAGPQAAPIAPTCGHPQEVFNRLGLLYVGPPPAPAGKLLPSMVPTQALLVQLPSPSVKALASAGDTTYDLQKDELCALGPSTLSALYVSPQSTMTTAQLQQQDDTQWIDQIQTHLGQTWGKGLQTFLQGIIDWASSFGFLFIYPKTLTYDHVVVKNLQIWTLGALDGVLALILVIGGYNYLLGHSHDFREIAPRIALVAVAAHFSLYFITQFVELVNTMSTGVFLSLATTGITLPWGGINWATSLPYEIVAYLLELVASVFFVLVRLGQIALLDLLIITAPLGFLCFALPQTQAWGRLWAQALASVLVVQFLQVLCLSMGSAMIATFGHGNLSPITVWVGLAALLLAFRLPNMVLSNVLRASRGGGGGGLKATAKAGAELAAFFAA